MERSNQNMRNITRYTYKFTSFMGWRVALCRKHMHFVRYFGDREYGGKQAALEAALVVRDLLLKLLAQHPDDIAAVFEQCRHAGPPKLYRFAPYIGPCRRTPEEMKAAREES